MEEISVLTLKASIQGREKIKDAREQRGLAIEDTQWLYEVSNILEPDVTWNPNGPFAVSLSTFKRFLDRTPIKALVFQAFCQVLGLYWKEVVEQDNEIPVKSPFYVPRKSRENLEYIEDQCYEEIQKPGALIRI